MTRIYSLLISLFFIHGLATAQLNSQRAFPFLKLPPSARISALGGSLITVVDDDVALAYAAPSLLNEDMHQALSFSNDFYFEGINHLYAAYGHHEKSLQTTFHGSVNYMAYGNFDAYDEAGNTAGSFNANDWALTVGASRKYTEQLRYGANLKFIHSNIAGYTASGIGLDLSGTYIDTASNTVLTLTFKNLGYQLSTYQEESFGLPFDIQLGYSKRLRHLPFRFSIILHNLQQWNIAYNSPNEEESSIIGEAVAGEEVGFFDHLSRHFIFNGEFLFGKKENLRIRFGYNHQRRAELRVDDFQTLTGFSFGAGIKIKGFRLDYGTAIYHLGSSTNHLTLSTKL